MANRHRGEIDAVLGGRRRTLVLTLGALAELEAAFGAADLVALAERFGSGRLSARDLLRIIGCGLRGAGEAVSDDEVAAMARGLCPDRGRADRRDLRRRRPGAMSEPRPFPWQAAMRFGFGVLRLSPAAFWSLTPRELACAIRARRGDEGLPLDRTAFDQLMRRFPDRRASRI